MIRRGAISVEKGLLPAMNTTLPYSPRHLPKARAAPVKRAGNSSGRIIWKNIEARLATRTLAAYS